MKTMSRVILMLFMSLFLACQTLNAFAAGPGTTNANFLKAGQGVRPIAMGETYIALGDGLDTLYWNPAGLVQISSPAASFIHSFWMQDIGTEYLAYGMPMGPMGALGGGITYMHAGTIEQTLEDEYGNYAGVGGQASAMSIALVGAYSQKLSRLMPVKDPFFSQMLVGASLRIITESIDEVSIFGGGVDIGAIWRQTEEINPQQIATAAGGVKTEGGEPAVRDRGLRFGFVAQNLGVTSDQLMPINFRVGAGYVVQDLFSATGRGTVGMDVMVPIDNDVKVSVGAEYANISPNTEFAVRVGYKIGNEIRDLDSLAGMTAGAGFAIVGGLIKYQVDYAFVPYGDLGTTHRAALTLSFLPSENVVKLQPAARPAIAALETAPVAPALAAKAQAPQAQEKPAGKEDAKSAEAAVPVAAVKAADSTAEDVDRLKRELSMLLKRVAAKMDAPIIFARGESKINAKAQDSLNKVGKILAKNEDGDVVLVGYGETADLSLARAKAVERYLKMNFKLDFSRISTKAGQAAEKPVNSDLSFEVTAPKGR